MPVSLLSHFINQSPFITIKKTLKGQLIGVAFFVLIGAAPAWGLAIDRDATYSSSQSITEGLLLVNGHTITLNNNVTLTVGRDVEVFNGTINLNNGSELIVDSNQKGYGVHFGWRNDPDTPQTQGPVVVNVKGTGVTIGAGTADFISLKKDADLILHEGAEAELFLENNGDDTKNGIFIIGDISGDFLRTPGFKDFSDFGDTGGSIEGLIEEMSSPGGHFTLGKNSTATVKGRAFFGNGSVVTMGESSSLTITKDMAIGSGGTVDVGLNTLTVSEDAYFLKGSIYKLNRTDSANGKIAITGKSTIEEGAIVQIGGSNAINSSNNVILTATNSIEGTYFTNALYTFKFSDDRKSLMIDSYRGSSGVISQIGRTGNYANAGTLIDQILTSDSQLPQFLTGRLVSNLEQIDALTGSNPALAEIALKQLIGESTLAVANAYQDTLAKVNATMNNRFQAIRGNNAPAAGYGAAENRIWVGTFGQWGRQKNANNVYGYDYNSGGIMLGYDRELANVPGLTLGVAGNLSDGALKSNDGYAETDIKTIGLSIYGSYEFGNGFFLDADLGYGHANNDSTVNLILGGKKTGESSSNSFQAGLNLGYDIALGEGNTTLTPSAGLRFTHIKQNHWQETIVSDGPGALANWFDDTSVNFVEIPLNLKLSTTIETNSGAIIEPELRVGGIIAANNPKSELRIGFVGSNDSALISGIDPGKSRFTVGAGLKVQLNDTVDVFAGYDLEARNGYKGHSASLGLGFSF